MTQAAANDFGAWLSAALDAMGMSNAELARRVRVSRNTVGSWRKSTHQPALRHLRRIAVALELPFSELAGEPVARSPADELLVRVARLRLDKALRELEARVPDMMQAPGLVELFEEIEAHARVLSAWANGEAHEQAP